MKHKNTTFQAIHQLLVEQLFYVLLLSSAVSILFYIGRVIWTGGILYFAHLVWNLFLAWIPYLFSLLALAIHRRNAKFWQLLIVVGIAWLLFYPNAAYILTNFNGLEKRRAIPFWYDIGLIVSFAWTGCFLAIASLRIMHQIVNAYWGKWVSWLFVLSTIGLTGFGIYLGRYLRWNSWDIVTNPQGLLSDVLAPLIHPFRNIEAIAFSIMFATILLVMYLTFNAFQSQVKQNAS